MHTFFVMKQVQVAVVGASGYTGQELLRILLNHRGVRLVCATSRQYAGQPLWEVFPRFRQVPGSDLRFTDSDVEAIAATGAEVAFLALPHGVAASYARGLVDRGVRVIDLSADFRLNCPDVYEEYYGNAHPDTALMKEAVYGLPEWRAAEIARARIVASPGCYPTSILLPLIPLFKAGILEPEDVVVCSGSGVSGAGRKASIPLLFCECNESFHAYGVPKHRHLSEIEQELSWGCRGNGGHVLHPAFDPREYRHLLHHYGPGEGRSGSRFRGPPAGRSVCRGSVRTSAGPQPACGYQERDPHELRGHWLGLSSPHKTRDPDEC